MIGPLAFRLHLLHRFFVHLNVPVDHHLFEKEEVLDGHYLLQEALVDALFGAGLGQHEVSLRDA